MGRIDIIPDYASTDGGCSLFDDLFEFEPALGDKVYVVNLDGKEIYGFEVYAKGSGFFIPKGAEAWKPEYREIKFDEHGSRWFYSMINAKAFLTKYLTDEEVIVDEDEDFAFVERL